MRPVVRTSMTPSDVQLGKETMPRLVAGQQQIEAASLIVANRLGRRCHRLLAALGCGFTEILEHQTGIHLQILRHIARDRALSILSSDALDRGQQKLEGGHASLGSVHSKRERARSASQ